MDRIKLIKLKKNDFSVSSLFDESDEKEYWLSQTPNKRLEATELMRQINYGYDPTSTRLQRVFTITELKSN